MDIINEIINKLTEHYIDTMVGVLIKNTEQKFKEQGITVSIKLKSVDYDYIKAKAQEHHDEKAEELQKKSKITV